MFVRVRQPFHKMTGSRRKLRSRFHQIKVPSSVRRGGYTEILQHRGDTRGGAIYVQRVQPQDKSDVIESDVNMPAPAVHSLRPTRSASAGATHSQNGELVLKNLAEQLLSSEELWVFKQALQHFRVTHSVPSLCTALRPLVTNTERLMLLVELAQHLPAEPLRKDFQKLCTLQFPKYHTFLRYFTPQPVTDGSKVIAQDSSGQLLVANKVFEKNAYTSQTNGTVTSEPRQDATSLHGAESGFYSEHDDLSRQGYNGRGSISSWAAAAAVATSPSDSAPPTLHRPPRVPVRQQVQSQSQRMPSAAKPPKHRQSLGILGSGPLKILSGSFQSLSFGKKHGRQSGEPQEEEESTLPDPQETSRSGLHQKRILLARRSDGSLGVGIKGGKEYGTPIVVYVVEDGCQAQEQGLKIGDHILDVNGTDFTHLTHAEAVTLMRNAWNVIMTVQSDTAPGSNNGRYSEVRSEEGSLTTELDLVVYPSTSGRLGCVVNRDTDTGDVVVKNVEKNSAAGKAGLLKGDIMLQIDGMMVNMLSEMQIATLTHSKRVRLRLRRALFTDKHSEIGTARSKFWKDTSTSEEVFNPVDFSSPAVVMDDDMFIFAASTPRKPGRSRSEERVLSSPSPPPPPPPPQNQPYSIPISPPEGVWRADTDSPDMPVPVRDTVVPRMYRPRTMAMPSSHSQHHQQQHVSRNSGVYNSITRGRAPTRQPPAQSPRYTIVYSVRGRSADTIVHHENSRSRKPAPAQASAHGKQSQSRSSKMRYIRNRSRSRERRAMSTADRDLLQAVQAGVEKRQRALRLSMYQVADDDDDDWKI